MCFFWVSLHVSSHRVTRCSFNIASEPLKILELLGDAAGLQPLSDIFCPVNPPHPKPLAQSSPPLVHKDLDRTKTPLAELAPKRTAAVLTLRSVSRERKVSTVALPRVIAKAGHYEHRSSGRAKQKREAERP